MVAMARLNVLAAFPGDEGVRLITDALNGCEVHVARSGPEANEMCREGNFDVVIADGVLPGMDGYALAEMIRRSGVVIRPGVIITAFPGMARDISLTGVKVLARPFTADDILHAIEAVLPHARRPSGAFETRVQEILDLLGVPAHPGRDYLAEAVFLACEDMALIRSLTGRLYPRVGERFGVKSAAVERAMRHVIDVAWAKGSIDSQYEIFKNTIDAARGKPTCGGMIAQLAHMLRREVF